jgi:hypothetical protein
VMTRKERNDFMDNVSGVLIRCFFMSFALLFLWFFLYLLSGNWGYRTLSGLFELNRHDYDLLSCYGMAFLKICAIIFFLIPYLSIKLLLYKENKNN